MPKSYEAIYDHGQLKWIDKPPSAEHMRVIVTVVSEIETAGERPVKRHPSPVIAGKGKTLGDIIVPIIPEPEWDCLK